MIRYLEQFQLFTQQELDEFSGLFSRRSLKKGELFVREGTISQEVAFVQSGIFRSFYVSEAGEELTYCFRFPDEWMTAYSSFITGLPSIENMQAIGPAEILVGQKQAMDRLAEMNPKWMKFMKIMAEKEFLELEKRVFQLQRDSASRRYQTLSEEYPAYLQQLPVNYLASYLGITQRHLSRIRKEIVSP